jgi:hypothetical protein
VDNCDESTPSLNTDIESNIKKLMGLFDLPAFARRGQDVEFSVRRLHDRCRVSRSALLEMVRLRLRQWSRAVSGPEAWSTVFTNSIEPLWPLSEAAQPEWAIAPAPFRRRRAIARDLITSTKRFNSRWTAFVDRINLDPTNLVIDQYNRYYVLEKECVMGSARLAARHFIPVPRFTKEALLNEHPLLPVPELLA